MENSTKRRNILLIILLVLIVLIIIFYIIFGNNGSKVNEYTGNKDLHLVEEMISDNEYYMFEDNGQKYMLFKMSKSAYAPQRIEIDSAYIYNESYSDDKKLNLKITLNTKTTNGQMENGQKVGSVNTDAMLFIQEIENDCTGLIINDVEYKQFQGGVIKDDATQKYGFINTNGEAVLKTEYTSINELEDTYYNEEKDKNEKIDYSNYMMIYKENEGYGIITKNGDILIDCIYTSIINYGPNTFVVTKGNMENAQIGIIDINGNILKEFRSGGIFDETEEFEKYAIVSLNNKKGVMNRNLDTIIPIEYDEIKMRDFETHDAENKKEFLFAAQKDGAYEIFNEQGENAMDESIYKISQLLGVDINSEEVYKIYNDLMSNK